MQRMRVLQLMCRLVCINDVMLISYKESLTFNQL